MSSQLRNKDKNKKKNLGETKHELLLICTLWTKVCNVVQVMQIEHSPMATMPGKGETTKPNPDQIVSACSTRRQ